jgi:hypothetical protein
MVGDMYHICPPLYGPDLSPLGSVQTLQNVHWIFAALFSMNG